MASEKEPTVAETLIEFALEDKMEHQAVMARIPAEKLAAMVGRKARLIIEGEDGGMFIIKLTLYGVFREYTDSDIRNEIWMTDATFIDIVIGELDPKAARARGQVLFSGTRSLYDAAEIIEFFEKWMSTKMRPVAQRLMRTMAKGKA
ncbi:hypothetical protein LCGC14_0262980 [marine sediment metagenome]|uniref:SCP2 domain-containing protein n=1 Tax=marine sediment metagenome TaxID=412755 RepID=A0A0F9U5Z4_9ZZZZ